MYDDWIRAKRKAAGMSQKTLAFAMNISQSQMSRIETEPECITFGQFRRLTAELGIDPILAARNLLGIEENHEASDHH